MAHTKNLTRHMTGVASLKSAYKTTHTEVCFDGRRLVLHSLLITWMIKYGMCEARFVIYPIAIEQPVLARQPSDDLVALVQPAQTAFRHCGWYPPQNHRS